MRDHEQRGSFLRFLCHAAAISRHPAAPVAVGLGAAVSGSFPAFARSARRRAFQRD